MKKFLLLCACFFVSLISFAIGAYPYPVSIKTPSGEMMIYLKGNESFKYAMTPDGFPLVQQGSDWFFATIDESGNVSASPYRAEKESCRGDELKALLTMLPVNVLLETMAQQGKGAAHHKKVPLKGVSRKRSIEGKRNVLVVLMQFMDVKFSKSKTDFDNLFNKENYTTDGAKGSVYDYYKYASYGKVDLHCDVLGPFDAQHEMAYYGGNVGWGGNDKNPYALFSEALKKAASSVNLTDYDMDGDGYIDNLHIIYAGYGEEAGAASDAIWAHEMTFEAIDANGVKIDRYSCAPELRSNRGGGISRIGPHCHEIGHALGAMDYYDTNYNTDGYFSGTGKWDVMASGSWNNDGITPANFNPYVKAYDYGWCDVIDIKENMNVDLLPSSNSNIIYRLNTSNKGEFFLLENRQQESFDVGVPGHGLLIFHVGEDVESSKRSNTINASFPQNCYVVCASSGYRIPSSNSASYGSIDSDGCPYPGSSKNTAFDYYSTPAALCNNSSYAGFALSSIAENDDKSISLYVDFSKTIDDKDEPNTDGEIVWQDLFEKLFIDSFWSQECIEGNDKWSVKQVMSISNPNKWLQLSPTFSPFDKTTTRVVTRLKSSEINLEEGEYVLSVKMACTNTGDAGVDSVKVIFFGNGEVVEGMTHSYPVVSEVWSEHSMLVERFMLPVTFAIDGICYKSSELMIDDVIIRKRSPEESSIEMVESFSESGDVCYTLTGIKVSPESMRSRPGIYIQNGKKIIIN